MKNYVSKWFDDISDRVMDDSYASDIVFIPAYILFVVNLIVSVIIMIFGTWMWTGIAAIWFIYALISACCFVYINYGNRYGETIHWFFEYVLPIVPQFIMTCLILFAALFVSKSDLQPSY